MTGEARTRLVRYLVVPLLVGGAVGWVVGQLPAPWPLVIIVAGVVGAVGAVVWASWDLHRIQRQLEELVVRIEEADGRVAYLATEQEDGRG